MDQNWSRRFLSLLVVWSMLTKSALQPSGANRFSYRGASNFPLSLAQRTSAYGKYFASQLIKREAKTSTPLPSANKIWELLVRRESWKSNIFPAWDRLAWQIKPKDCNPQYLVVVYVLIGRKDVQAISFHVVVSKILLLTGDVYGQTSRCMRPDWVWQNRYFWTCHHSATHEQWTGNIEGQSSVQ